MVYMSNLRPERCSIVCIAGLRKRESMVDTTSVSSTLPELTRARALIRRSKFGAERPTTRPPVRQGTRTSGLMSHDRSCPIIPANPWPPPGTGVVRGWVPVPVPSCSGPLPWNSAANPDAEHVLGWSPANACRRGLDLWGRGYYYAVMACGY